MYLYLIARQDNSGFGLNEQEYLSVVDNKWVLNPRKECFLHTPNYARTLAKGYPGAYVTMVRINPERI
jgi:hypothetical protein